MYRATRSSIKTKITILGVSLCIALVLGFLPAWAQESHRHADGTVQDNTAQEEKIDHDSSSPVDITSDSLEMDDKKGMLVFRGDVVAKQDNATIYSDQLDVYYTRTEKNGSPGSAENGQSRSIEKIVARGSVRIVQKDRIATGERAEYEYSEGSMVLTGSPTVVQGDNTISGEKITVYLDNNRSIVEGGVRERVKATFVPDDDDDK